uniref:Acetyltransferase component of pyruvate dehydrogenase complex n=1 Tax=Ascaris lumbricoides TaxID=6252 RepID=A0A9J2PW04_ASCLU
MMSKFSTRGISSSLRSMNGFHLPSASIAAASLKAVIPSRAASTCRLSPLFGGSPKLLGQLKYNRQPMKASIRFYSPDLPEHKKIPLPALSPTMEKGNIVSWQKKEGDELAEGDLLCEIETDKATMGFETPEEGFLAKILISEGTKDVPIGKLLCIIVSSKDDVAAFANYSEDGAGAAPAAAPAAAEAPAAADAAPAASAGDFPEHKEIPLPALSPTMEKGNIVSWQKKEGDELAEGDVLCEIETDKATMGFETPEEGFLAKILIPEGTKEVPIGKLLCVIVSNKDDVAAFKNFTGSAAAAAAPAPAKAAPPPPPPAAAAPPPPPKPAPAPAPPTPAPAPAAPIPVAAVAPQAAAAGGRVNATPYAKRLAAEKGVNLAGLVGTGPGGRILAADVLAAPVGVAPPARVGVAATMAGPVSKPVPEGGFIDIPVSEQRLAMAKRVIDSKIAVPHYYLSSLIFLDEIMKVREKLNNLLAKAKGEENPTEISLNAFFLKASALACLRVPEVNSFFMDTFVRQNNNVDICLEITTESGLTVAPVIYDAHIKGVSTISQEIRAMIAKVKEGTLLPQELEGGTITVTNMGEYESIHNFAGIITRPQSSHLAIGHTEKKLVPSGDGGYKESLTMNVTLATDHRVVDGAVGAQWLKQFKDFLEKPHTMLL